VVEPERLLALFMTLSINYKTVLPLSSDGGLGIVLRAITLNL
jgi:hypothetical protein